MKACTKCGTAKDVHAFARNRRAKDGLQSWCKTCMADYRAEHKAEIAGYREADREGFREYSRAYYATHREEKRKYNREYNRAHQEARREAQAKYMAAHPEKFRAYDAKHRALKRNTTTGNPMAIAAVYDLAVNWRPIRCYLCGRWTKKGERHVDHIVPLAKGGKHAASNLAIACAACNLSKYDKMPEEVGVLI